MTAVEATEVVVVGAGQAGIAMSEHLSRLGLEHLVLERGRIAESWRSARWDSLVANGPAWHDRFPGMEFPDTDPDAFVGKERVADYFVAYAEKYGAPVRTGVEVTSVVRREGAPGFDLETTAGPIRAAHVFAATGAIQIPVIPPVIPDGVVARQLHSSDYRNPADLPDGAVLVVGAGSSGAQIADEVRRSGRTVYLCVGPHDRPPRRYRGRDNVWWLGVLGLWDAAAPREGAEHVTIAVSGARGGATVDFRDLAAGGIRLLGRAERFADGVLHLADDLGANIAAGDANYLSVLRDADAFVVRTGLQLPEEPEAHLLGALPDAVVRPTRTLDLGESGISTVIWATGFRSDYGWLRVDAFDEVGAPRHQRGVSAESGVYFLGLPWQSRRGSSFIWGVWHDARHVAEQIAIRAGYAAYSGHARPIIPEDPR